MDGWMFFSAQVRVWEWNILNLLANVGFFSLQLYHWLQLNLHPLLCRLDKWLMLWSRNQGLFLVLEIASLLTWQWKFVSPFFFVSKFSTTSSWYHELVGFWVSGHAYMESKGCIPSVKKAGSGEKVFALWWLNMFLHILTHIRQYLY